jgi:DNA polymerase-3 subunit gamma/tau
VHQLTKLRAVPSLAGQGVGISVDEQNRIAEMAGRLSMPSLGKAWQILLKGLNEVNMAANPQSAAEMVIIRLSYGADLPDPSDLLKKLASGGNVSAPSGGNAATPAPSGGGVSASRANLSVASSNSGRAAVAVASQPQPQTHIDTEVALAADNIRDLEGIVQLLEDANEMVLAGRVYQMLHLVRLEQKAETYRLEVRPQDTAPDDLLTNLSRALRSLTGKAWMISPVEYGGAPTLAEKAQALYDQELIKIKNHPLMKEVYAHFPEAEIIDIQQIKE